MSCNPLVHMRSWILTIFLFLWWAKASASGEPLQVVSYNAGLLTKYGIELNVCVEKRIPPQLAAYDRLLRKPFILNVQEVWTAEALSAYFNWAKERGYQVMGYSGGAGKNGSLIITSEPIVGGDFSPFPKTGWGEKDGILRASIKWNSILITDMNTHAAFSGKDKIDETHRIHLESIIEAMKSNGSGASIMAADLNAGPDVVIKNEKYNPIKEIWKKLVINKMPPEWLWTGAINHEITWDQTNNPQVYHPAKALRYLGLLDKDGGWGWSDSQLDHIFVTEKFAVVSSHATLNQAISISGCGDNPTFLSDHYAWEADLEFRQ